MGKIGSGFKPHFQPLILEQNFRAKEALHLLTSGILAVSAEPRIDKSSLLYRGGKSAKPHPENSTKSARVSPIYKETKKQRNVRGKSILFEEDPVGSYP